MQKQFAESYVCASDIVLISSTGSGKTLAYLLPIISGVKFDSNTVKVVIIVPSRELALQIEDVIRSLSSGLRVVCCYGGHNNAVERRSLEYGADIIVATPGRLLDHIERQVLDVSQVDCVVLDEFDKSLEFGFEDEMSAVFYNFKKLKKRVLVSATAIDEIPAFVGVSDPVTLDYAVKDFLKPKIEAKIVECARGDFRDGLFNLLAEYAGRKCIVFCNFREATQDLSDYLWEREVENEFFHGAMEQQDRERVLIKFKNGSCPVLVATDLAARGLDVDEVACVIHYQMPQTEDAFIHRNGRTARMEREGDSFILKSENEFLRDYIGDSLEYYTPKKAVKYGYSPEWTTLYIGRGKKDKLGKGDIVGFICSKCGVDVESIGQIDLKDFYAYVAVRSDIVDKVVDTAKIEKLKGRKTRILVCK